MMGDPEPYGPFFFLFFTMTRVVAHKNIFKLNAGSLVYSHEHKHTWHTSIKRCQATNCKPQQTPVHNKSVSLLYFIVMTFSAIFFHTIFHSPYAAPYL